MVYLLSAALSPFFGILIDKTGRNVMWVILSIITTIGSHFLLAFTFVNPYVGVMALGVSYSLLASGLWPLVAMIVPESQLGTAYGICQAVQNLGLATVLILAGVVVDKFGYLMLEMFFLGCLFIALIAAVLIYIVDSANSGVLNLSPQEREALKTATIQTDERANLLDHESSDPDEEARPSEDERDSVLTQSDRIRSRYISHILPNTNIPDRP
ncbi:major facilitator superfamily domain-containing protein 1-like isoform X2 [Pieris napi]|nr:major facilitator superfamily domain-containing protein 1-like isoform X2 [Pieris napi]